MKQDSKLMDWPDLLAEQFGFRLWVDLTGKGACLRLSLLPMHIKTPSAPFVLPLSNADGESIGDLVFQPLAQIRGQAVYEAVQLQLAHQRQTPRLSSVWSDVLGLQRGGLSSDR